MQEVQGLLAGDQVHKPDVITHEVNYFFNDLGLNALYFQMFTATDIANHLTAFISAKEVSYFSGALDSLMFHAEEKDSAIYICPTTFESMQQMEQMLEEYLAKLHKRFQGKRGYSVSCFTSAQPCVPNGNIHLTMYLVHATPFLSAEPPKDTTDIKALATERFQQTKLSHAIARYQEILNLAQNSVAPVCKTYTTETNIIIMLGISQRNEWYTKTLTLMLEKVGLQADRAFVETFANNLTVYSIYLKKDAKAAAVEKFTNDSLLLGIINWRLPLAALFNTGALSAQQVTYAIAAARFCYYFMTEQRAEGVVKELTAALKKTGDQVNLGRLNALRDTLRREALTDSRIYECIQDNVGWMDIIYNDFLAHISGKQAIGTINPELATRLEKEIQSEIDRRILLCFLKFNAHVTKTNFLKPNKAAVSYKLDAHFLQGSDLNIPFGIFLVIGSNFRGFHVRFKDIARGGIRMVKSPNIMAFNNNLQTLFAETYGLADTQQKKNKDIPEGGSKGTILLDHGAEGEAIAFTKYVDALLDLITGAKGVVNRATDGAKDILFLGPDEYTADLMEPAARQAQTRGYPYWKAFTTGKGADLGGMPHDKYGMTTHGVRTYAEGIMEKLRLDPTAVTKVQTGGPDGDLGSNEILMSKDRTIAVLDKNGVIYDPAGLDRVELQRLAQARDTIDKFDSTKIGTKGFKILISDRGVTLPNGMVVDDGTNFRNEFCLNPMVEADFFLPCGGRPATINISNVHKLIYHKGEAAGKHHKYKYIVEGANLFITQDARLELENAGVVLFKDASANKGGVTSSSLEVLAALAMSDKEHEEWMQVKNGRVPEFYEQYVNEVIARIKRNARVEFELLWDEHLKTGTPRCVLTDVLSDKINELTAFIENSPLLWNKKRVRRAVLNKALPSLLINRVGLERIMERVPEAYLLACFSSYLASGFVYRYGLKATEFDFYQHMQRFNLPQNASLPK